MANIRVLTKKSTVAAKVPVAGDLQVGELAVNTNDQILYTKHSDGTVRVVGVSPSDTRLTDNREWSASTVTQAVAEAGTDTTRTAWTAQRVRQSTNAWWASGKQGKVLDDLTEIEDAADIDTTFAVGGYIVKEDAGNVPFSGATILVSANGGVVSQLISVPLLGKIGLRRYEASVWGDMSFTIAPTDVQMWYGDTTSSAADAVINADGTFSRSLFVPAPLAPKITASLTAASDTDILRPAALTTATTFPNPTGSPMDGFGFVIELIDDGTARALTWGSDYAAGFAALPTTTTAGKLGQIAVQYRSGKYRCDGVRWMA